MGTKQIKRGRGRPPITGETLNEVVRARVSAREMRLIRKRVGRRTLTQYLRDLILGDLNGKR